MPRSHQNEYISASVMLMPSNDDFIRGNAFRIPGHLWGESTGGFSHRGQWRGALMFSLIRAWTNGWANNRDTGDLRRYPVHYEVTAVYAFQRYYHAWIVDMIWGNIVALRKLKSPDTLNGLKSTCCSCSFVNGVNHYGQVMPYGDNDMGKNAWFR